MIKNKNDLVDWSLNPFVCSVCNNIDKFVNITNEVEGYPYSTVIIKCSKCGHEQWEII